MKAWLSILTMVVVLMFVYLVVNKESKPALPSNPPVINATDADNEKLRIIEIQNKFNDHMGFWSRFEFSYYDSLWYGHDIVGKIKSCSENFETISLKIDIEHKNEALEAANIIGGLYPDSKIEVSYE